MWLVAPTGQTTSQGAFSHCMHGHRLEKCLGIVAVALVVGIDANPVHVAADDGLLFADDGDVVLRLAGQHAVVAAHAGVQVDRHAPGVVFFFIGIGLVEREPGRGLVFLREVGLFAVFLERGLAHQRTMAAVGRVHALVALGGGQLVSFSGLADLQAGGDPRRGAGAQRVGVEADRGADAAGAFAAVS